MIARAVDAASALAHAGAGLVRPKEELISELEQYAALLVRWNPVQNLVSRETLVAVWQRHFADSVQLFPLLGGGVGQVLDVGSGAGFPALPLAILLKGSGARVTLIESNHRKVAFLRTVARELDLEITVIASRAEAVDPKTIGVVDVVTARAVAPLTQLLAQSEAFWWPQTRALFPKGREHGEELVESRAQWQHDIVCWPSTTDPQAVVLEVSNLRRIGAGG